MPFRSVKCRQKFTVHLNFRVIEAFLVLFYCVLFFSFVTYFEFTLPIIAGNPGIDF